MKGLDTVRKGRSGDASVDLLRRSRPFRWYWAGQSLSFLGSQVAVVALPLVAALSLGAGPAGVLTLPLLVGVAFLTGVAGTRTAVLVGAVRLGLSALPMLTRRIRTLRTPQEGAA